MVGWQEAPTLTTAVVAEALCACRPIAAVKSTARRNTVFDIRFSLQIWNRFSAKVKRAGRRAKTLPLRLRFEPSGFVNEKR
jgi:hypothetical protein